MANVIEVLRGLVGGETGRELLRARELGREAYYCGDGLYRDPFARGVGGSRMKSREWVKGWRAAARGLWALAAVLGIGAIYVPSGLCQTLTNAWWDGPGTGPTLHLQFDFVPSSSVSIGTGGGPYFYTGMADSLDVSVGPDSWLDFDSQPWSGWPLADGTWDLELVDNPLVYFDVLAGVPGQIGNFPGQVRSLVIPEMSVSTQIFLGLFLLWMCRCRGQAMLSIGWSVWLWR